jgi:hypothetical protein
MMEPIPLQDVKYSNANANANATARACDHMAAIQNGCTAGKGAGGTQSR